MRWLTFAEILRTSEGIESGLCINGLKARIKTKKSDTLEKLLKPKRDYKVNKKSSKDFLGCPDEMVEALSGTNRDLLNYKGGRILKIRGQFLVSKDVEIDEIKYNQAKDKEQFIKRSFIHAIADQLEVKCERVR